MKKYILLLLIGIVSQSISAQHKFWIFSYEPHYQNSNERDYKYSNQLLIKQTRDSIYNYQIENLEKPNVVFAYKIERDTLYIDLNNDQFIKANKHHDTLRVFKRKQLKGAYTLLKESNINIEHLKKMLYTNSFSIEPIELYNPYGNDTSPRTIKFIQNVSKNTDEIRAELIDFENFVFIKLHTGNKKRYYPIQEVTKNYIKILSPETKKGTALFKSVKNN